MVLPTSTDCAAYMYVYNRNIVFTSYKVDVAFLRIKLKCRFESFFSMNPLTLNIVSLTINQSFDPSGNYRFCNELQLSHPHFCESTRRTKHWSRQSTFDDKSTVAGSFFEKSTVVGFLFQKSTVWSAFETIVDSMVKTFSRKVNCCRISDRPRSRLLTLTGNFEDFEAILYEFFRFPTEIRWKSTAKSKKTIDSRLVAADAVFFF
jgi:hypothetical protein